MPKEDLIKIAAWMRSRAADVRRQCTARRQAAECMRDATGEELKIAAQLTAHLSDRPVKTMTVKAAKQTADTNSLIAGKLEAEEAMLLSWAECLEQMAA